MKKAYPKASLIQIFSVFLCILTLITASAADLSPFASASDILFDEARMGDIDNNGKVTSGDARIILRCSVNLEPITDEILLYADFDKNGQISADDARTALRISVGLDSVHCIFHGHILAVRTIHPSCTQEGYSILQCNNCSYIQGESFDITAPAGHSYSEAQTPATCTQNGIYTSFCERCGVIFEKRITEYAKGHSFGIWQLNGETKSKTCYTCYFTETAPNVKTIYLTFDDGPGPYTEKLLGYLREYNVKATFFVTNQMPKYRSLLKSIVDDGHAIGVHTLTHQWSVYSSQTSYLNDFNAMHDIILADTGVDTKLFRFPGGTNNTVSRSYSKGIMTAMASYMRDAGYINFDWNVDSGDTSGYSSSKIAQYTISQIKNRHSSVVLMHDIKNTTVEAIRTILQYGIDNGYEFAVLDESTPRVQFSPVN